ncbi:MAG: DNA-processing protein DprA [Anaerolineaceae bacterium]|nr:MAG: DNA-protecting protein DprA [Chloroflexi bacterium HGW-Chloroflexi-8]
MDSKIFWVGFNLVKGIGAVRMQALQDYFGDLERAWNAPYQSLCETGLNPKICERIIQLRNQIDLEKYWQKIISQNIQVITRDDVEYPRLLNEINQPPPVLYIKGSITLEDEWAIAIVGTRKLTHYGRQATEEFAKTLADHKITVVSGLARGIDAVAHKAVIEAGGRTFAVLGSGVDRIYPSEHKLLADNIIQQGAVISDYAPGTSPDSGNFPPRNRIISGLSRATIVIEAGEQSGALITAEFAADQGRDVYALPGSIFSPQSKGTNRLIQNGAKPLIDIRDLLQDLQVELIQERKDLIRSNPLDMFEQQIMDLLSQEPLHVDEITQMSHLPVSHVSAYLSILELKGVARQVGGMKYVSIHEKNEEYQA